MTKSIKTMSICLTLAFSFYAFHAPRAAAAVTAPVTVANTGTEYILDNGIVKASIDKNTGKLRSMVYRNIETIDTGYWSHAPIGPDVVDNVTISPRTNGGERGEVSISEISNGRPLGGGPGGSTVADIEIRYALERGSSGLYTYTIFVHRPEYPATSIGEARYCAKLNDSVFDWMTVDKDRNMEMITAYDWDHGTTMNMKEARLMNTGIMKGQVEHKYDYSAVQFDTPAYGWSSTQKHVGFWIINPSDEYLSGGPTKVELSAHRDATFTDSLTAPAPPTLLNYWRGSHYGGSECDIAAGESWTKVVGPFMLYCNAGHTPDSMWNDAKVHAKYEATQWPYNWVFGVDYPHKSARGIATGTVRLKDPQAADTRLVHLLVGLTHPDYMGARATVDWQRDAKFYQYWAKADGSGNFTIPNIRPGSYTLRAIADNVLGEYVQTDVLVTADHRINLGTLTWTPVRYGQQLWDIGIPDRTAKEFLHGDNYWHWGLYNMYPTDFPNDVNYTIGKSNFHKDWNYAEVPRAHNFTGRGIGPATTWSIHFNLSNTPHGTATLRVAIAASSARQISVGVNATAAGTIGPLADTATIRRDGIRGYWQERDLPFSAVLMKKGLNTLTLTVPAGGVMNGIEYDYLRLELNDSATQPGRN